MDMTKNRFLAAQQCCGTTGNNVKQKKNFRESEGWEGGGGKEQRRYCVLFSGKRVGQCGRPDTVASESGM